jgi:hypothetical protein
MEDFLPNYSAHVLDSTGGRIQSHNFAAEDRAEATTHAFQFLNGHRVEVCQDDDCFTILKPQPHSLRSGCV